MAEYVYKTERRDGTKRYGLVHYPHDEAAVRDFAPLFASATDWVRASVWRMSAETPLAESSRE